MVVSSYELVDEVCDDKRFQKSIQGDLEVIEFPQSICISLLTFSPQELRAVVHDGLFTVGNPQS